MHLFDGGLSHYTPDLEIPILFLTCLGLVPIRPWVFPFCEQALIGPARDLRCDCRPDALQIYYILNFIKDAVLTLCKVHLISEIRQEKLPDFIYAGNGYAGKLCGQQQF